MNRICLSILMVAAFALSVQAGEKKEGGKDKEHPAKPIAGQVTAVSVSGDSVSWTIKTEDGEKTLAMPAAVNAVVHEGKIVMLHAGGKAPKEKEGDKMVGGNVTAASLDGEVVKLTITTADGAVEGQLPTHIKVRLDKDGKVVAIHGATAHHPRKDKKEKVQ